MKVSTSYKIAIAFTCVLALSACSKKPAQSLDAAASGLNGGANGALAAVPGSEGDFGVLAGHAPMVASLRPGVLTIKRDSGVVKIVVLGGFAEVSASGLTVLADNAVMAEEFDVALGIDRLHARGVVHVRDRGDLGADGLEFVQARERGGVRWAALRRPHRARDRRLHRAATARRDHRTPSTCRASPTVATS